MDAVVAFYALSLSQLINPDVIDFSMRSIFRMFKLNSNYILRPHFDGNMSGELLYSPDFLEAALEKVKCNKEIILEFGYRHGMPKDSKYTIQAVNLRTKQTAESVIDKRRWDCYYNLFRALEGKVVCIRAWKRNLCVYDLISFVTVYDMPHVYKREIFPDFSRYISKKYIHMLNLMLTLFSSMLNVEGVITLNFVLLMWFFVRFVKREVLWRYFCIEFARLVMSIQDFVLFKFGVSVYKRMSLLHTCCPDDRKIKNSKYVSRKFLVSGWKGHNFYKTNDRISIPVCVSSLENHLMDLPLGTNDASTYNFRGIEVKIVITESTSYKYKVKVETNNSLEQKLNWEGYVKVPNFHCFIDAITWLGKENTYHIRTFQPYREIIHAKNVLNMLRDINEQDFLGFGVLIINRNSSFYIGNEINKVNLGIHELTCTLKSI